MKYYLLKAIARRLFQAGVGTGGLVLALCLLRAGRSFIAILVGLVCLGLFLGSQEGKEEA